MKIEEAFARLEEHNKLASKVHKSPTRPSPPVIVKSEAIETQNISDELPGIPEEENKTHERMYSITALIAIFATIFVILGIALTAVLPNLPLKLAGLAIAFIVGGIVAFIDLRKVVKHHQTHFFYSMLEYLGFKEGKEDLDAMETVYEEAMETADAAKTRVSNIVAFVEEPEKDASTNLAYQKLLSKYEHELAVYNNFQRKVALSLKNVEESIAAVNEKAKSWKVEIDYRTKMVKKVNVKRGSVVFDYDANPEDDVHFYGIRTPKGNPVKPALGDSTIDVNTQPMRRLRAS